MSDETFSQIFFAAYIVGLIIAFTPKSFRRMIRNSRLYRILGIPVEVLLDKVLHLLGRVLSIAILTVLGGTALYYGWQFIAIGFGVACLIAIIMDRDL
jgi:hypothetical protein